MEMLAAIAILLLSIRNYEILCQRYFQTGIYARIRHSSTLVTEKSRQNSRDPTTPTLTVTKIHKNLLERVSNCNKILRYENAFRRYASLQESLKDF